jgi:hypothetical protein
VTVSVGGRVLDVPALLDAATGATEYMRALLAVMTRQGYTVAVPSVVRVRAAGQLATAAELAELDWFCAVGSVLEIALAATASTAARTPASTVSSSVIVIFVVVTSPASHMSMAMVWRPGCLLCGAGSPAVRTGA